MVTNVCEYLETTAKNYPYKTAIVEKDASISFHDLHSFAKSIATVLIKKKIQKQSVITFLPKSIKCVAAFAGIVDSGNFYTPVDISMPEARIDKIIKILNPSCVITSMQLRGKIEKAGFNGDTIIIEDVDVSDIEEQSIQLIRNKIIDTDPVYVLFTSGSTGEPKGVIITHRNIIDYIEWAVDACGIDESTVMGNQSPFHFDISTQDIYSCFKTAATLVIIPETYFMFPIKALEFIRENGINYLYWVPSAFINVSMKNSLNKVDISCVRKIIFGGEVMPVKHLKKWQENIPGLKVMNVYGPTEATVNITYYNVERSFDDSELLPLGYPCGNTELILLGEDNKRVTDPYIKGELCARGSGLSPGYWNNKEKTQEVFVQNPLNEFYNDIIYKTGDLAHYNDNGELVFDGRKDFQIKHMGYRIELGEIEANSLALPYISECCCVYDDNQRQIVLYLTDEVEQIKLMNDLKKRLPRYMLPNRVVFIKSMPHNHSGKIDRALLKELL